MVVAVVVIVVVVVVPGGDDGIVLPVLSDVDLPEIKYTGNLFEIIPAHMYCSPFLYWCWASVSDVTQTPRQHWVNVLCKMDNVILI